MDLNISLEMVYLSLDSGQGSVSSCKRNVKNHDVDEELEEWKEANFEMRQMIEGMIVRMKKFWDLPSMVLGAGSSGGPKKSLESGTSSCLGATCCRLTIKRFELLTS